MKNILICFFLLYTAVSFAQSYSSQNPDYINNVTAGERCLSEMKYDSCIYYYKTAFKIKQSSFLSTLRAAACAFSASDNSYLEKQLACPWI